MNREIDRLLEIMAKLRDPISGCEWDRAQSFETIAPYTLEEAYEVADAIQREDIQDLRGELGDLLFQVVFHARMAEEAGHFDFHAVAKAISDKMETRHPHIFGQETGQMDGKRWEDIKAAERATQGARSSMDGVAKALPALARAEKLQKRAVRDGFDWPDPSGAKAKILEEIAEIEEATDSEIAEEAGDLLFAVVNYVRMMGVTPEDALRAANLKFERRYRGMEDIAGGSIAGKSLDEQEALWQSVKDAE